MDQQMIAVAAAVLSAIASAGCGILTYMLREKNDKLKELDERVDALRVWQAQQSEKNENNDKRFDAMDKKLDRILEKLGA